MLLANLERLCEKEAPKIFVEKKIISTPEAKPLSELITGFVQKFQWKNEGKKGFIKSTSIVLYPWVSLILEKGAEIFGSNVRYTSYRRLELDSMDYLSIGFREYRRSHTRFPVGMEIQVRNYFRLSDNLSLDPKETLRYFESLIRSEGL